MTVFCMFGKVEERWTMLSRSIINRKRSQSNFWT